MPGFDWWTGTATGIVGRGIAENVGNIVDIGGQLFSFGDKAVRDAKRAHAILTTAKSVAQPLAEGALAVIKDEIRKAPKSLQERAETLAKEVATGVTDLVKTGAKATTTVAKSFAEQGQKEIKKITDDMAQEAGRSAMKSAIPYIVIAVIAVFIIGRATK